VEPLTIHDASQATGWSARMLRYIERVGLVDPPRSASGYRLYGPAEVSRLRSLRELTTRFDISLSDLAFARRLDVEPELRAAADRWLAAGREPALR
jgi:MerR family transcriptional regulator, copper efflux regulator